VGENNLSSFSTKPRTQSCMFALLPLEALSEACLLAP
jgi:hypothetical protein